METLLKWLGKAGGYKTFITTIVGMATGVAVQMGGIEAQTGDTFSAWFAANSGTIFAAANAVFLVLRSLTDTSIFKKTSPAPLPE